MFSAEAEAFFKEFDVDTFREVVADKYHDRVTAILDVGMTDLIDKLAKVTTLPIRWGLKGHYTSKELGDALDLIMVRLQEIGLHVHKEKETQGWILVIS